VKIYEPLYFWLHPSAPQWVIILVLATVAAATIACAVIDLKSMIIPNVITYPLLLGLLLGAPFLWQDWVTHLVAGLVCAAVFVSASFLKIRGQYAMGMGDAKLYTVAGLLLGLGALPCVIIATLSGTIIGLIQLRGAVDRHLPHGPHIALGILVMIVVGCFGWLA
jgi:prepilin signal peptidase PulO-like enzyme (type II secretory pathway)